MDAVYPTPPLPRPHYNSSVDTSRPFRSVKEAVAIFGERILMPEIHTPNLFTFPKKETPFYSGEDKDDHRQLVVDSDHDKLKKLEAELEDAKAELKLLKERESEMEVTLASLNAELQKNLSKLTLAETTMAEKAGSDGVEAVTFVREEEKKRDAYLRSNGGSPSLAQILSVGEKETVFAGKKTKTKKQQKKKGLKMKPIIPLVGELFNRKKGSAAAAATALHNPLYASSHLQWD